MKHVRAFRILLLLGVLVFGVGVANAQAPGAPVLVRVEIAGGALPALPLFAQLRDAAGHDYALVIAPLAQVQASGAAYRVLDQNARTNAYVVARERRAGARANATRIVSVLHDDGSQIVARVPFTQADALAALGFSLQRLSDPPIVLGASARMVSPRTPIPNATIAAMMAQVQSSTLADYTRQLSGETAALIGGSPYTIGTRHTNSGTPIQKATQFAYEHLLARGLSPSYHYWTGCGISNRNVVGQKTGTLLPNEIVLITAHLDDMPGGAIAPGADDNASGSVGVMIAADIFSAHQFQRTLRFVFFTGEEQGLCGATQYAAYVKNRSENIIAVYNMDMIAWDAVNGPTLRVHTRATSSPGYAADLAIANTFSNVVNAYGLSSALTPIITPDSIGYSDHAPFWYQGYPGVLAIEDDDYDFNAYYHTTNDRFATINVTYFTNYVKASIGTVAHLADYVAVTGVLRGTITDAATLVPITNAFAQVSTGSLPQYVMRTDASGVYSLTVPVGVYNVTASATRYIFQTATGARVMEGALTTRDFALTTASEIYFAPQIWKDSP